MLLTVGMFYLIPAAHSSACVLPFQSPPPTHTQHTGDAVRAADCGHVLLHISCSPFCMCLSARVVPSSPPQHTQHTGDTVRAADCGHVLFHISSKASGGAVVCAAPPQHILRLLFCQPAGSVCNAPYLPDCDVQVRGGGVSNLMRGG